MTRDEARKFSELIKAYLDGKQIQSRFANGKWKDLDDPEFLDDLDFYAETVNSYRIKSEPREVWVKYDGIGHPVWVFASEHEVAKDIRASGFTYILMREVMS